jgi:peptidoglycan lytic transglycosylase
LPGLGATNLTRHQRSTLLGVISCAALFAIIHCAAAETTSTQEKARGLTAAAEKLKTVKKAAAKIKEKLSRKAAAVLHRKRADSEASDKSIPPESELVETSSDSIEAARPTPETSETDVALVRKAIESVRKGAIESATQSEIAISDPAARKLVEWVILRSNSGIGSKRYTAFIAANPGWPNLTLFHRYAEERLWGEDMKPAQVLAFFKDWGPQSARGRLALARALIAQGDSESAGVLIREAWRYDPMGAEFEQQVLKNYSELLTRADHKARMEKRLFAADSAGAMRMAQRLGGADLAIAKARIALNGKGAKNGKMLESVPAEARQDPGYLFARAHILRHQNKIAEAAQVILSAPNDVAQIHDPEEWWVERRILARKLLDMGDVQSAYLVVRDAAEPIKENSRVERTFMAGWIALRFLNDPTAAQMHFAHIQEVSAHPTSLARSHYWLGRTAEAFHRPDAANAEYAAAARSSAAYYGQLARARLGIGALAMAPPPATPEKGDSTERRELVRALEILYALNERSLVIPFMAGAGDNHDDLGVLSALGQLAEQYHDARGMLHMGKAALGRGLPLDYYAFPTVGVPRYSPIGPGIDTALVFAIIRQESMFDPADLSAANAMGLMQVTPAAGRDTCKRFGCKYDVKRLKNDSPYNLQLGAAELGGVIEEYRGNYIMAFAAYNAGRGRVDEWIKTFGDPRDPKVDPVDWVERIPIMETRNYVQRVMENMQVYRTRFGTNAPLTIQSDLRGRAARN